MKKFLCLALVFVLLTGMTACDSSPSFEIFYFSEMNDDGVIYTAADLQNDLDKEGKNVKIEDIFYLKLYEDGTAVMCSMGAEEDMKYNSTEIWSVKDETVRASYSRNGDTLSIRDGAAVMTYRKG